MTAPFTVRCPAKLNLALHVGPPDPSDPHGRHPVASLMAALRFSDELTIRMLDRHDAEDAELLAAPAEQRWTRRFADDSPQPQPIDWPLEQDLAFRAQQLVAGAMGVAREGWSMGMACGLVKRIPSGAGLGGGSADAAGMLNALRTRLRVDDPLRQPFPFNAEALARQLGSDVAFALQVIDQPTLPAAVATGFGDRLDPLALPHRLHFALVLPPFACPTAPVYRAFDALNPNPAPADADRLRPLTNLLSAPTPPDAEALSAACFNDLTDAAVRAQPRLRDLLARLTSAGLAPHVTGSGSAVFLCAASASHSEQLAKQAEELTGFPTIPVATL